MEFIELIKKRHSIRSYKNEQIPDEILNNIIDAAKLAPASRNKKPCDFILIKEKSVLEQLSKAKNSGSQMLKNAGAAIVVTADSDKSDVWIEDAAIAMTYLHLAAENYGLGSCWIQIRNRKTSENQDSTEYIKKLLKIEKPFEVLAVLSVGFPE